MSRRIAALALVFACALAWPWASSLSPRSGGVRRDFLIRAHQYAYDPPRIVVDQGDEIHLVLAATDAVHGFFLDGYDREAVAYPGRAQFKARIPSRMDELVPVTELAFVAGRPGKFRYRCSVTCGALHPFMQGEFIVRPNRSFQAGVGGLAGILLAALMLAAFPSTPVSNARPPWRLDLLERIPLLGRVARTRWFPFALVLPLFACFLFFLLAGYLGTPIGNRNVIITVVWIFWWFVLITTLVPLGGRIWCMVCPFPLAGEWAQRRRLVEGPGRRIGPDGPFPGGAARRWPAPLANTWIQLFVFLSLCTFSTLLVTRPIVSALVLSAFVLAAAVLHLLFRDRAFCSYLCPLNGWMSLYSMAGALEVRSRRGSAVCGSCASKACRDGTDSSWPCPWGVDPGNLDRNNYCGLCLECVKGCRHMTLRLRPLFSDARIDGMSEAYFAFVMVTLVVFYSLVMQGPWGEVKRWANFTESGEWRGFIPYAAVIWTTALAVVPGLWWGASRLGRRLAGGGAPPQRVLFLRSSYMLVPLGLLTWVGFTFPLILLSGTHILGSLSDPLGRGWDLFGTAHLPWKPYFPEIIPPLQTVFVLAGLAMALRKGGEAVGGIAPGLSPRRLRLSLLLPHALLCAGIALLFLRLFAG